jgi:hypothetical protein
MASNHKKKTTMAKMARENAVRERRLRKQARKDARKREAAQEHANPSADVLSGTPASPEN